MKIKCLTPMLATADLAATIAFYGNNLGFECRGRYPEENPCWASLWNGDVELAFSIPNDHEPFERPVLTGSIYLYVEDVETIWEKLKDAVEVVYGLETFGYGMREFGIRDNNGYILNIGENVE